MIGEVHAPRWVFVFAGTVAVCVGVYHVFNAIDTVALEPKQEQSKVINKARGNIEKTYSTQILAGGRARAIPHQTGLRYLLTLKIAGQEMQTPVEKSLFDEINKDDPVTVQYYKTRITDELRIASVVAHK